jgi:TetR/AcrR family transcriptional repressor of nem operon
MLVAAGTVTPEESGQRAYAIYAAISGAQLVARGRSDISLYDTIVDCCRSSGLLPG